MTEARVTRLVEGASSDLPLSPMARIRARPHGRDHDHIHLVSTPRQVTARVRGAGGGRVRTPRTRTSRKTPDLAKTMYESGNPH